jgi:predicted HTH transcriptional regulator
VAEVRLCACANPLRVQALIANMTQPALSAVAGIVQVEGAEVLVVEVPDSPRVVGTTRGTYVRRAIAGDGRPTCVPYHAHEMLAHEVDRGAVDWAALRIGGATWADLDPLEFERLRRLTATAGDRADRLLASLSDREIASALGFMRIEAEVTAGTLLLFGRSEALGRFLPTHEAAFQVLRGLEVEVNDFLPYPLLRLAEEMFTRFQARNGEEELQFGMFRVARDAAAPRGTAGPRGTGPGAPGHHHRAGQVMQRTDAETRNILARMVERGWIEARGEGKGRSWHLSAAVYRVLDAPAGYVRVHGFEPLQQEQMVLQYVDAHGQITRTEAAELCSLTPDQASRLLRRLAKDGKLKLRGERRGSEYVRPTR